jgi:hypothetical protein
MTIRVMTFSITTLIVMTFSMITKNVTPSIMTLRIKVEHCYADLSQKSLSC